MPREHISRQRKPTNIPGNSIWLPVRVNKGAFTRVKAPPGAHTNRCPRMIGLPGPLLLPSGTRWTAIRVLISTMRNILRA